MLGFFLLIPAGCILGVLFLATAIVKIEPAFRRIPPVFDETDPVAGSPAPLFALSGLDGKEWRLADHLGAKPVLIEFGSLT